MSDKYTQRNGDGWGIHSREPCVVQIPLGSSRTALAFCGTPENAAKVFSIPVLRDALKEGVELEAGNLVGAEFTRARNAWLRKARAALKQAQGDET